MVKREFAPELPSEPSTLIPIAVPQDRPAVPASQPPGSAEPRRPIDRPAPTLNGQPPVGRTVTPPDGRIGEVPAQLGRTSIEQIGPDQFILSGDPAQIEALNKLLEELDRAGSLAEADIEVVPLKFAESAQFARLLTTIYTAKGEVRTAAPAGGAAPAPAGQQGKIGFIPVAQPNAIVVVGRKADLPDISAHVRELDNRSKEGEQFRIFQLKLAPAAQVAGKLTTFFGDRAAQTAPGATGAAVAQMRARVEAYADERTNSVFVYAGPVDMEQAAIIIERLDRGENASVAEIRFFVLKNAAAADIQNLLQNAVLQRSQAAGATTTTAPAGQAQPPRPGQAPAGAQAQPTTSGATGGVKSSKLRLLAADRSGAPVESGILEDITIMPDPRTNGVLVTAPKESMGLIEELIRQLDSVPNPTAELKVMPLMNADAQAMLTTLQSFFGQDGGQGGGVNQGQLGQQFGQQFGQQGQQGGAVQPRTFALGGVEPRLSLTPLTFSVDQRTNSLIVSGSPNDLIAVEALVYKLDGNNARERKNFVYRLNNVPAEEAEITIQNFLQGQAQGAVTAGIAAAATGALTLQQQIAQDVVIVADLTTNSLIISSSPRYLEEVLRMIQILDRRPPQVVIQCLIAEVTLQRNDEFGVELGYQTSNLFDRSIVAGNELVPGVNFNTTGPLRTPQNVNTGGVGYQTISNLSLGRSGTQGFGGLVFAASSQNVSVLLRALSRQQRLDVLSRPQLTTLDNRQSQLLIGQSIPTVTGTQLGVTGVTTTLTQYRDIGIILAVQPQIGPDGVVVMRVNPQVSSVDQTSSIPITTDASGNVIATAPVFNVTNVETTVVAADGQTVVVAGLIARQKTRDVRKVPYLGDLPILGNLFRVNFSECIKRELIIVLTPRIVYCDEDVERVKSEETARMQWCLPDVYKDHGDIYAPAYPSVEGGDRCTDVLGQEIPANLRLPAQGRPRARTAMGRNGWCDGRRCLLQRRRRRSG